MNNKKIMFSIVGLAIISLLMHQQHKEIILEVFQLMIIFQKESQMCFGVLLGQLAGMMNQFSTVEVLDNKL